MIESEKYSSMPEFGFVGIGIGGGFNKTEEIHVLTYEIFACEDQGPLKDYIGCQFEYDTIRRFMKISQPLLVQSFSDEFSINQENRVATPGVPRQILRKGESGMDPEEQFHYRKGTGKLMHLQT
jgi:hypothetical protein